MRLNDSENGIIYDRFFDAVRRTEGLVALVAAADEIGIFFFAAAGHSAYHRTSAVCTVNLPRKRMDTSCPRRASGIIHHEPLDKIKLRGGNNRIVGIFCPRPFVLRLYHGLLDFVIGRCGFTLHQRSGIDLILENPVDRNSTPQSNLLCLETGTLLRAVCLFILDWRRNIVLVEPICNLCRR